MDELNMLRKLVAIKGLLDVDIELLIKQKGTIEAVYKNIQQTVKE